MASSPYLYDATGGESSLIIGDTITFALTAELNMDITFKSYATNPDTGAPFFWGERQKLIKTFTRTLTVNRVALPGLTSAGGFTPADADQYWPDDPAAAFTIDPSDLTYCVFRYQPRTARQFASLAGIDESLLKGLPRARNCITWFGNQIFAPKKYTDFIRYTDRYGVENVLPAARAGDPGNPGTGAWQCAPTDEYFADGEISDEVLHIDEPMPYTMGYGFVDFSDAPPMPFGFDVWLVREWAALESPAWGFNLQPWVGGYGGPPGYNPTVYGPFGSVSGGALTNPWPGNTTGLPIHAATLRNDPGSATNTWPAVTGSLPAPTVGHGALPATQTVVVNTDSCVAGTVWTITATDSTGTTTAVFELTADGSTVTTPGNIPLGIIDDGEVPKSMVDVANSLVGDIAGSPLAPHLTASVAAIDGTTSNFTLSTVSAGVITALAVACSPDPTGQGAQIAMSATGEDAGPIDPTAENPRVVSAVDSWVCNYTFGAVMSGAL